MRILVTGSRDWTDENTLWDALWDTAEGATDITVVTGGAKGADGLAWQWARHVSAACEEYPADWNTHGKAAGPIRNQEMVDLGADICLAFPLPDSRGTWDCVRRAKAAGIPVKIFEEDSA